MPSIELKDFVNDTEFINKMNQAFADLRADYELSLDVTKEKIDELTKVHVDNKNYLSNLTALSVKSSGVISGLRGTGKTHLFLLARNNINNNIDKNKTICIYLNVKRLHLPSNCNQEVFNRVFSVFIYDEISKQLMQLLKDIKDDMNFLDKLLSIFKDDKHSLIENIGEAIKKITIFKTIATQGSDYLENFGEGEFAKEELHKSLIEFQTEIASKIGIKGNDISTKLSAKLLEELNQKVVSNNKYLKYLNINSVRDSILDILKILNLNSITFFIDEWEKLYKSENAQEFLSFYIDKIIDNPIYFWIGIVPYRGHLYYLDNGADLQHFLNLDESLVYESSKQDRDLCIGYFKEFINKRLAYYFTEEDFNYSLLFNVDKKLELLVLASMGNSRDFGTMLLNCWSSYQAYRSNSLSPGRPFKYINQNMIINSIKNNGDKKFSNIKGKSNLLALWRDIESFCLSKKYSHFAIEDTKENMEAISTTEFSELTYHRLLHFRKGHVPPKDTKIENKLSIYALNYAGIYDLIAKDRKINFVTEYDTIHDRVRRYIYDPKEIVNKIKIISGEIFPCVSCKNDINIKVMVAAWEKNSCPFCGGRIRNQD
ncbi:hypothetical protein ACSHUI_10335 [Bacillus subtilis]|jgi:hypothetical protein|uniref:hypothetical protein n=1 Tax=Bacillus subtilis TaxID=1423 RepID=UPI0007E4E49F|nr:hypothetical protein [Bacillus subtilis]MDF4198353.1 hypothetical protein [Bacillus subtilis]MDF4216082.1 hypothetical protein [Bacillus subtilis]OAY88322.1 hypothetical protein AWM78_07370 [Bacillus subtilis subsp. subtilis]RPK09952.1 hypothetical protein EH5_02790 [Bacillus subtilis]GLI88060.1 hypothetical protein ANABIO4_14120 [Bacillus subtilis]